MSVSTCLCVSVCVSVCLSVCKVLTGPSLSSSRAQSCHLHLSYAERALESHTHSHTQRRTDAHTRAGRLGHTLASQHREPQRIELRVNTPSFSSLSSHLSLSPFLSFSLLLLWVLLPLSTLNMFRFPAVSVYAGRIHTHTKEATKIQVQ